MLVEYPIMWLLETISPLSSSQDIVSFAADVKYT